jgi:hypothetical protein
MTADPTLSVHLEVRSSNRFGGDGKSRCTRQNQAVKYQGHPSLAKETSRIAIVLKVTSKISAPGEDRASKQAHGPDMTDNRDTKVDSA